MHVKTSKEVTDRQKACGFVLSVVDLQGPSITDALTERFGSHAREAEPPGFLRVIVTLAQAARGALTRLVEADEAHYAVKARHNALLKWRNRLVGRASQRVVGLRRTVVGQHDEPDLIQLGFGDETAREAVPLLRQLDRIVEVFENGELDPMLGETLFDGTPFDPQDYARQLKSDAVRLRELLDQLDISQRRVEDALLEKQRAMDEYDQLFLRSARIFEDYCRLAGRSDLADRVRPSVRRPGRTEQQPPEETSEESTAQSDEAVAEAQAEAPEAEAPRPESDAAARG